MATLTDIHKERWGALVPDIPYTPENGIPTFWRQHPELGSPLGPETAIEGGGVAQAFAGGIVTWDPENGAQLVQS